MLNTTKLKNDEILFENFPSRIKMKNHDLLWVLSF